MKILLAIDTSPRASETLAAVQRMFAATGASVVVLCVVGENEPETIPTPVQLASVAQNLAVLEEAQLRTHVEIADRAAQTLRDAGLEATSEIRHGDPRHVVVAAVRSHAADLVVVGRHCHSAAHQMVMGCVASYLVDHAPCQVLVVPHVQRETKDRVPL